ncbi:MAG: excinuclease ABC subunit C, partial [Planctomycetes bacterium]|nr:excinuclease ABC subunit C [Planctomycetota bacterium]
AKRLEEVWLSGDPFPVILPRSSQALFLLLRIRDEAHRFAITYHRKRRESLTSRLDGIPGVGPARRRKLLREFGSLQGVGSASLEQLRAVVPDAVAEAVFQSLRDTEHDDGDQPRG